PDLCAWPGHLTVTYMVHQGDGARLRRLRALAKDHRGGGRPGIDLIALVPQDSVVVAGETAPTGGPIYSSPAVANGLVYVGSDDGNLYAFDAITGTAVP